MAQIQSEIESGKFEWLLDLEDVHLNIEKRLTELVGDAGNDCIPDAHVTTRSRPTSALHALCD
jgi:argininosuccinate lyase